MSTTFATDRPVAFEVPAQRIEAARVVGSVPARLLLACCVGIGLVVGFALTGRAASAAAVAASGPDLTRLLRGMALLKMLLAAGCLAGIGWRLGSAVRPAWLVGYLAAAATMSAGPGVIWDMAHIAWGAALLHGGLGLGLVLLWRDRVCGVRLQAAIRSRRGLRSTM